MTRLPKQVICLWPGTMPFPHDKIKQLLAPVLAEKCGFFSLRTPEFACHQPCSRQNILRQSLPGPFPPATACQCSSVVEQRFRKPSVAGSIPAIGSTIKSRSPAFSTAPASGFVFHQVLWTQGADGRIWRRCAGPMQIANRTSQIPLNHLPPPSQNTGNQGEVLPNLMWHDKS